MGAAYIADEDEDIAGTIAAPWALDTIGDPVRTWFTAEGSTLTHHVVHEGAAYPVIADPQYTWGWGTGTVYYNRKETKDMRNYTTAATAASAICVYYGPATFGGACVLAGAVSVQWMTQANRAWDDDRCLKIKVPTLEAGSYPWGERVCTDCPK